jgi:hypothetical protein
MIAISTGGPFPHGGQGSWYLMIAMTYFTYWPEAYSIPSEEASTVVEGLVTNFCCFGVHRELHIDQDRNFKPCLRRDCYSAWG